MVHLRGLSVRFGDRTLFGGLQARLLPGLHWVLGDEGSGKSTLLAVLAGRCTPTSGSVERAAGSVYLEDLTDPRWDAQTPDAWLADQRALHPAWDPARAEALIDAFALGPHRAKPLCQLSAGSRRKVGLVAADASGAALTLLDQPFAALDQPSRRALLNVLRAAAASTDRVWAVADYVWPDDAPGSSVLNLDDPPVHPPGEPPAA